jgi:hypothetical protein
MRGLWLLFSVLIATPLNAAVFQYAVSVPIEKGTSTAYLWVPADAKQVRGVIVAGNTVIEKDFVKDPAIRRACSEQQLALIWMRCGLTHTPTQAMLDSLAKLSGYGEIAVAPLMFVGHSAGGPQAQQLGVKFASRCFGTIQYRGGGPFDGTPLPANIPSLIMMGEFDEFGGTMRRAEGREHWDGVVDKVAAYRGKDPAHLASILVEPGAGHFPWSQRNADYAARFITKAAAAKIPANWPTDAAQSPQLLTIDPKAGWLTSLNLRSAQTEKPAAADGFAGEIGKTAWHFDRELAEATLAYHQGFERKDQFVRWTDPYWVDAGVRHFFNGLKWVGDGQTFEVRAAYADKYPANQPDGKGPKWTKAGQSCGQSTAPIKFRPVFGAIVPAGENRFRVQFDNLSPAADGAKCNFLAYSEGDAEYRYTEQIGMSPRGLANLKDGKAQTITFPPIELPADLSPTPLKATSDSGLAVEYYVAAGPGEIRDGKLVISELPQRSAYPIELRVVAYQFGSGVEPKFKTAAPVEQVLRIEKPASTARP